MTARSLAILIAFVGSAAAQQGQGRAAALILDHPCPAPGSYFGHSTVVLDMDGVGGPEVAVGAFGQGAVYVHHQVTMSGSLGSIAYQTSGFVSCPVTAADDLFGYDVAAGDLDGDPEDELVVGVPHSAVGPVEKAGRVLIFRHPWDDKPLELRQLSPQSSWFGDSVAVGDFDGDGAHDVAVSAPKTDVAGVSAGAVHVFFGPFGGPLPASISIPNPQPILNGNFGHHLAVADVDLNGIDDLVISAIGNSNQAGLAVAGQVYVHPGPIDPAVSILIEDPYPDPNDLPGPRFGMHVNAREDWVLVGANRKDWVGVHDAGMGFSARGPGLFPVNIHPYPTPKKADYMGFRCVVADVVGDSAFDLTYVVMPNMNWKNPNSRALVTWDGNDLFGPPKKIRAALPFSADHFSNGLDAAQIVPGGRDELITGDGTYDLPGTGDDDNTGRVVIYSYE